MLILYVCLMKAPPHQLCSCRIVCVRLHQHDMSLMWKYNEHEPSQPHSSPQQDTSTAAHMHTRVFEFNRDRNREAKKSRKRNAKSHKPKQAPKVANASVLFCLLKYHSAKEVIVLTWALPEFKAPHIPMSDSLYVNAGNLHVPGQYCVVLTSVLLLHCHI